MSKLDLKRAHSRRKAKGPHCLMCGLKIQKPGKLMSLGLMAELLQGGPSPLAAHVEQKPVYNGGMRSLRVDLADIVKSSLCGRRRP